MRRFLEIQRISLVLFVLLPVFFAAQVRAEEAEPDEWTVMFYFCGSDLESEYGFATGNLEEIAGSNHAESILPEFLSNYGLDAEAEKVSEPGKVNVLIETGGATEWHCESLGINIQTDALQRWRYNSVSLLDADLGDDEGSFELLETQPLQSMADPGTLSDFIRWGTETCPAKKYALVLWDHGGGAKTGLFIDELFKGDVMYLYELKDALKNSGVHLDTLVIDACLMANMETAWAVSDSADYLVASEEVVPGKGTAIDRWLQGLYGYPSCDGEWLSRSICDMTAIKYANETDMLSRSLLTWSVLDLSQINDFIETVDELFQTMDEALLNTPSLLYLYSACIFKAEEYGDGMQNMRDFGSVINNPDTIKHLDLNLRGRLLETLSKVISYSVRGSGRAEALGLSFCYPADFDDDHLNIYAKNFPLPSYLAYLDAISSWTAPDWVYKEAERLPEIDTIEEFDMEIYRKMSADGMPEISIPEGNISASYYRLYQLNEATGQVRRLGRTVCTPVFDEEEPEDMCWRANDPMHWPAIEGQLCCIDLVQYQAMRRLYNIPVQIDSEPTFFRCGRVLEYTEDDEKLLSNYEIFGVWQGYDEDSDLMNRSVTPLAMLQGQDYKLLYPIDDSNADGKESYEASETQSMYRSLPVEEIPLPLGTYYLEYEIRDIFLRPTILERIEIHWDGENMTFPEGFTWEGQVTTRKTAEE